MYFEEKNTNEELKDILNTLTLKGVQSIMQSPFKYYEPHNINLAQTAKYPFLHCQQIKTPLIIYLQRDSSMKEGKDFGYITYLHR